MAWSWTTTSKAMNCPFCGAPLYNCETDWRGVCVEKKNRRSTDKETESTDDTDTN